jgi:dipeptidyl aminopeptidase/acylaminoacyl peptidase
VPAIGTGNADDSSSATPVARWCLGAIVVTALGGLSPASVAEQAPGPSIEERYRRAEAILPWHIEDKLHGVPLDGAWSDDGRYYTYRVRTANGAQSFRLDARTGRKTPFAPPPPALGDADDITRSPGGRWALRVRDGDLFRIAQDGAETALTADGEPDFAYASTPDSDLYSVTREIAAAKTAPVGVWSPDGTKFLTYRFDQRNVRTLPMLQSVVPGATHQVPKAHAPHVALPGDREVTTATFFVFDVANGRRIPLDVPPGMLADSGSTPETSLRWSDDGRNVYALVEARGYRTQSYYEADAGTGRARLLVTETARLPIRGPAGEAGPSSQVAWPLQQSDRIIFFSERDGWGHLYLYDTRSGELINRITQGEWQVRGVPRVDERDGWIYFLANGREPNRDPYLIHLYRVRLDGSGLQLLTPEDAHHEIDFSPDGSAFVDVHSTVEQAPVAVLRDSAGREIATFERGDAGALLAAGWRPPKRFTVLAADGQTTLYGTLYCPSYLDPKQKYPLLDSIYHGSHIATAPYRFDLSASSRLGQSTAELGFVVMILDARGTGERSQAFQDLSFGAAFGSPDAVADHIAGARQLAERHPYIDIERAGIYGHSWGGYRAARAMLQFPDFYKAAVASSGSHDNFLYVNSHELWFGMPDERPDPYANQSNLPLADQLRGKLLLVHGDVDDSVHPAQTLQFADALIRANKDFDLLILPGRNHDIQFDPYFVRRRWDYLVQHVMGETPPAGFAVRPPPE